MRAYVKNYRNAIRPRRASIRRFGAAREYGAEAVKDRLAVLRRYERRLEHWAEELANTRELCWQAYKEAKAERERHEKLLAPAEAAECKIEY